MKRTIRYLIYLFQRPRLALRYKLLLGFGVVIGLLLVALGISLFSLFSGTATATTLRESNSHAALISQIEVHAQMMQSAAISYEWTGKITYLNDFALAKLQLDKELADFQPLANQAANFEALKKEVAGLANLPERLMAARQSPSESNGNPHEGIDSFTQEAGTVALITQALLSQEQAQTEQVYQKTVAQTDLESLLLIVVAVVAVVVACAMALLITLSLTLSISQLKKHLRALAEGDLTQLAHIPNRDELGELGQTYNATLRALGQLARQLESQSRQVSTAVVALTSYARKNVSGSSQQSASINQITSTTHQLAATAQAIFNQAANVTEAVTSSYQEALNVQSVVEKMNEAHQRGQDTLLLTTSRLGSLSQEVYTIEAARASLTTAFSETSQVVEGVDEVAQQTHLLALNAAIEAASAGEYGERFSQIAQEVRALSQKATLGARKTASLLEVMGDAITQLAHACDRALELAKLAGSDTEQSQQVLAELLALSLQVREAALVIVGRVEGANTLAKEIGVATGQQKSATEQVLASLRDMAQLTQQTFQTAKESQEVTSGLDQSATQLLVSARLFKLAAY